MRIVGRDFSFFLRSPSSMSLACLSDLPDPLVFTPPMVFLGSPERFAGCVDGCLVPLLTTQYAPESSHGLGFKVSPSRSREGNRKFTQIKRRYSGMAV